MSFAITTHGFPSIERHADALAHFTKVKPYRGHDGECKPIATRRGFYNDTKQMRVLSDGSIAFRYHRTDCVIWHPDDSVTIEGWSSISTTSFIAALTPHGISHGQGSNWDGAPVLYLHPLRRTGDDWRAYWRTALVVRCGSPVRLVKQADRWMPAEPEDLRPFSVPTIDRKAARAAAAKYHLAVFEGIVRAIKALGGVISDGSTQSSEYHALRAILPLLEAEDYVGAAAICPTGGGSRAFGREEVDKQTITPGFLRRLRDAIYEQEMVVDRVAQPMLTTAQYRRHLDMQRRF